MKKELHFGAEGLSVGHLKYFHSNRWNLDFGGRYVHFWRKTDDQPRFLYAGRFRGSVPLERLEYVITWQPVINQLKTDAYVSINTVYGPRPWPTEKSYHRLTAVWVDCDCEQLDFTTAMGYLKGLESERLVPPISAIERTGRGVRPYWFLVDESDPPALELARLIQGQLGTSPPKAWYRNRRLQERINLALVARLNATRPELEPDEDPVKVTTHQRVAGSINSKVGLPVEYFVYLEDSGFPASYTLEELREYLGLEKEPEVRKKPPRPRPKKTDQEIAQLAPKRKAQKARYERLWVEFQIIRYARGGFSQGTRRHACYLAATILRGIGYPDEAIEREVLKIAEHCHPEMAPHEARTQMKSGLSNLNPPRNKTVARLLGVTVEEADNLELLSIRPDFEYRPEKGKRKLEQRRRHEALEHLAETHGDPLPFSLRQLAAAIGSHPRTVRRDLESLGIRTENQ